MKNRPVTIPRAKIPLKNVSKIDNRLNDLPNKSPVEITERSNSRSLEVSTIRRS